MTANRFGRDEFGRMLHVQSHVVREALPDDFAASTMAAVRRAKAVATQQNAVRASASGSRFGLAGVALASLVVLASLAALVLQRQESEQRGSGAGEIVAATPTQPANADTVIAMATSPDETPSIRTVTLKSAIVAPIQHEAEALLETGRDVGLTIVSALPAQPRAWTEYLAAGSGGIGGVDGIGGNGGAGVSPVGTGH